MSDLIERAAEFARTAHGSINQRRKYTNEPYIVHPRAVAAIVAEVTSDEAAIAAAWLHDVVEDTPVTIQQIQAEFGSLIAALVSDVTNVSQKVDGNRRYRKAIDLKHLAEADSRAKTIKLADIIDNLNGFSKIDRNFARVYLVEKADQLAVLKEGDPRLYQSAEALLVKCREQLDPIDI